MRDAVFQIAYFMSLNLFKKNNWIYKYDKKIYFIFKYDILSKF